MLFAYAIWTVFKWNLKKTFSAFFEIFPTICFYKLNSKISKIVLIFTKVLDKSLDIFKATIHITKYKINYNSNIYNQGIL